MKAINGLSPNDVIDIIAPSGRILDPDNLKRCESEINRWGYVVRFGKYLFSDHPFLSNTPENRWTDLHHALYDSSTTNKAIWIYRGGSGSAELLPYLSSLTPPPQQKIFLGFSDATSLHIFFTQQWNWITFHGPGAKQIIDNQINQVSIDNLIQLFNKGFSPEHYNINQTLALESFNTLAEKKAKPFTASLTGGNLTVISHGLGTPYQIKTDNKVLLLEDINEPAYKIRRLLTQLSQAGIFNNIKALILGEFIDSNTKKENPKENFQINKELFDFSESQAYPVFKTPHIGHGNQNIVVPFNAPILFGDKK